MFLFKRDFPIAHPSFHRASSNIFYMVISQSYCIFSTSFRFKAWAQTTSIMKPNEWSSYMNAYPNITKIMQCTGLIILLNHASRIYMYRPACDLLKGIYHLFDIERICNFCLLLYRPSIDHDLSSEAWSGMTWGYNDLCHTKVVPYITINFLSKLVCEYCIMHTCTLNRIAG